MALAWRTAALTRSKTLPSLRKLLGDEEAKPLKGRELERRKKEFAEMSAAVDLSQLGQQLKKETGK